MNAVYVHIPYCRTLCPYCDFVRNRIEAAVPELFVDALIREIAEFEISGPVFPKPGPEPAEANTIFFGGGTPSLLRPDSLERILTVLFSRFQFDAPEITIEANPDDVTPELADAWKKAGINRVSLGIQSFDDQVLRYLRRRHDAATARRACEIAAERFDNWSMDLIFGAPPIDAWESTLRTCLACAPKHVSTYGLTYESGTPFGARADEAVDDETWLRLYREAARALDGFVHYEISNFARPGYECRHNLVYWHNEEYAGFGPGAYSFVNGIRARNHVILGDYLAAPGGKIESLSLTDYEIRVETLIQHFRLITGLSKTYYARRFARPVEEGFGRQIRQLVARGLLEEDGDIIRPTAAGFEMNNEIGLGLFD